MREIQSKLEQELRQRGVDVAAWKTATERVADPEWVRFAQVRILPPPWRLLELSADGGAYTDGQRVIITSVAKEEDGRHWLHTSVTQKDLTLPSYGDLCAMKALFIGADRKAIMVFAPSREHINIHPRCLHLFCCLEGDPLPDFTSGLGTL